MKKIIPAVAALLLLLTGCANTDKSAPASPTAAAASPTAAVLNKIDTVEDINPEQVALIDYFDDRSPEGVASVTYSKADDIKGILGWLSQLKLTGQAEPQTTGAPGSWGRYEIKLFSGSANTISFNENVVTFEDGSYSFEDPSGGNPADTVYTIWMAPQHRAYPKDTGEIIVELFNQTGGEIAITFLPKLEKADAGGWSEIACQSQFCASSDPVGIPVMPLTIDMKTWYLSSPPGIYRLSMDAFDENGNPLTLSCVFELTET